MGRMLGFPVLLCGGALLLLVLAALVVLAVWALRSYNQGAVGRVGGSGPMIGPEPGASGETMAGSSRALEILRERYARGEITKEQFDAMRQDILS